MKNIINIHKLRFQKRIYDMYLSNTWQTTTYSHIMITLEEKRLKHIVGMLAKRLTYTIIQLPLLFNRNTLN